MSRWAFQAPPANGTTLNVPRDDRPGAYNAVVSDGGPRKNSCPPAAEDVVPDDDWLLATKDVPM